MGLPQGLAFRQTSGYVTDTSPDTFGNLNNGGGTSYPTTSPQGVTYGSEGGSFVPFVTSDRNSAVDTRLAGSASNSPGANSRMRLDLPTSGAKSIRFAAGDVSFGNSAAWDLYDTTTLLSNITTATSPGAGQFVDANNNTYSTANWPGSNTPKTFTFSTTILRVQANSNASYTSMAYFYVEDAASGTTHTASGALTAGSATIAGTASRKGNHSASGALVAGSAVVAGTANRFAVHTSSGALAAGAAAVAGVSSRTHVHSAIGALIADAAQVAGSASRTPAGSGHTGSGSLVAGAAVIAGSASRVGNHAATGALVAGSAAISGSATHLLLHTSTGALVGSAAVIAGSAARTPALVTHTATGALVADAASISGQAQNGTVVVQQNSGGYLPKKKHYNFLNRPANLAEEVRKQREELGILPKPVQLAVKAAARKATVKTVLSGEIQPIAPVLKEELQARGEKPVANVMSVADRAYTVYLIRAQEQARKAQEHAHRQQMEQDAEMQRVQQMNDQEDDDLLEILALMI